MAEDQAPVAAVGVVHDHVVEDEALFVLVHAHVVVAQPVGRHLAADNAPEGGPGGGVDQGQEEVAAKEHEEDAKSPHVDDIGPQGPRRQGHGQAAGGQQGGEGHHHQGVHLLAAVEFAFRRQLHAGTDQAQEVHLQPPAVVGGKRGEMPQIVVDGPPVAQEIDQQRQGEEGRAAAQMETADHLLGPGPAAQGDEDHEQAAGGEQGHGQGKGPVEEAFGAVEAFEFHGRSFTSSARTRSRPGWLRSLLVRVALTAHGSWPSSSRVKSMVAVFPGAMAVLSSWVK